MNPLTDNPFAALTFIAAPALLTNSSAVLLLSTSNRFARAIDRGRALSRLLDEAQQDQAARALHLRQLKAAERRVLIIVRALTAFYFAAGCFAAETLVSLLGATLLMTREPGFLGSALNATLAIGVMGVAGLVFGTVSLVWETRMALAMLQDEEKYVRGRLYGRRSG